MDAIAQADFFALTPGLVEQDGAVRRLLTPFGGAIELGPQLEERGILLDVELRDRRHAIETAAAAMCRTHDLDVESVVHALWQRELVGSTAIGGGVAIPHARIDGIIRPLVFFMRLKWAIDFDAPDGKPVEMILVVLVPSAGSPEDHLLLLKSVAEKFEDRFLRAQLIETNGSGDAWGMFAAWLRRLSDGRRH